MIECLYKPLDDDGIMRDGASESQSNQVLNIELDQMLKHHGEAKVPKFTVIVAQKNHQRSYFNQVPVPLKTFLLVSISSEDKKVVESKGIGRNLLTNFTKHTPLNLVRRSCL
ncbi:hypothetical protein RHGRI_025599 [Rhododendron griersonianum]|uniref:Piwi domain-containing protein n=1 Tax=Rhododendron griersonianum TaxID=479676 RepID=A0AAV6IT69_9ERIC|nr:hypothetical protein RHGRI_025599 [Rhododendron griersonianum]